MECETLSNGTTVWIGDFVRFGADALLLSRFALTKPGRRVLDLGTGSGIVLLDAADRTCIGQCIALDCNESACALVRKSVHDNRLDASITVVCGDLRAYATTHKMDIVTCNPPYFAIDTGACSAKTEVCQARHELTCTFDDVVQAARRNLKQGGAFCFCFRPERLVDALYSCRAHRLEPKRMQWVRAATGQATWLVLVEARLDAGIGLTVLPDQIG